MSTLNALLLRLDLSKLFTSIYRRGSRTKTQTLRVLLGNTSYVVRKRCCPERTCWNQLLRDRFSISCAAAWQCSKPEYMNEIHIDGMALYPYSRPPILKDHFRCFEEVWWFPYIINKYVCVISVKWPLYVYIYIYMYIYVYTYIYMIVIHLHWSKICGHITDI